ncbi:MAG: hypothetical protein CMG60_09420 [Candidatus Marinimicrobia bacterium]|nr:hypothetical protein [Candidatus Neomarinimicrobiota bacterium]
MLYKKIELHNNHFPDKVAVIDKDKHYKYSELWADIRVFAGWIDRNLEAGSRIGIMLNNSYETIISLYAITMTGRVCVPLDTDITPRNLQYIVNDCGIKLIIASRINGNRLKTDESQIQFLAPTLDDDYTSIRKILHNSTSLFKPGDKPEDTLTLAAILYTTGTTGPQKGVMLSIGNLLAATENINQFMNIDSWAVESLPMRLSHSFGFARLRSVLAVGGTVILEDGFLQPAKILENMSRYSANAISSVPAGFSILLDYFEKQFGNLGKNIRYIEIGSAPMQIKYKEKLMSLCPEARICSHYGLTEASRSTFIEFHSDKNQLNTVGKASPNVKIKIINEDGTSCAPKDTGEIAVFGHMVSHGYWNKPELTKETFQNGWVKTGDLGYIDNDGYVFLLGRIGDIINIGGLKVAPTEVEHIISALNGVGEVAAVGIASEDDITSESITAFIVKSDENLTIDKLQKYCIENLEPYKIPSRFVFLKEIPKTGSGKIQRQLLKHNPAVSLR